jgi:hypothetical protein
MGYFFNNKSISGFRNIVILAAAEHLYNLCHFGLASV